MTNPKEGRLADRPTILVCASSARGTQQPLAHPNHGFQLTPRLKRRWFISGNVQVVECGSYEAG
jgi:hypothetical protein